MYIRRISLKCVGVRACTGVGPLRILKQPIFVELAMNVTLGC